MDVTGAQQGRKGMQDQAGRGSATDETQIAPARASAAGRADTGRNETALTALVVDDSRLQRRLLAASLDCWGYEVLEAESGRAALEICRATRVDLVLSDWMMPEMDGLEFCRAFRALGRENYGYFILLTAKDSREEIVAGLREGADDFLTKPINNAELRARLHAGERVLAMQRELLAQNRSVAATLAELQQLYQAIDRDLEEAKKLQLSLVPETHQRFPAAEVSMMLRSSGHIGGDMVGYYHRSDSRLGLFAFDVSGHGISSALMTARLAGCLTASNPAYSIAMERKPDGSYVPRPPEGIAALMNRRMLEDMQTDLYLTILFADIDLATGCLRMVQAGHPNPVILHAGGQVEYAGCGGMPIGLLPEADFTARSVQLAPGDRFLIHSDGFTEARNPAGAMLGQEGFAALLKDRAAASGPEFLDDIYWETLAWCGRAEAGDDMSAVLVEYAGA